MALAARLESGIAADGLIALETELKLLIDPFAVPAFRRHPAIGRCAAKPSRAQALENIYFDTPDLRLRGIGIVWRVRRIGRRWVQTVKADAHPVAGLHRRPEWESPVADPQPDLAALMALPELSASLPAELAAIAPALSPVFRTEFQRTTWRLELPGGTSAELALDEGKVSAGRRSAPLCEIELELAAGDAVALFDFALELAQDLPLRIGVVTKAERGFMLQSRAVLPAVKGRRVALAPDATVEQAFVAITAECVAQMLANEAGVIEGGDADCLHQLRVGLRRLRTALRLFRRWIAPPQALNDGLDRLSVALGPARDAEVLAGETLARVVEQVPTDEELLQLQDWAAAGAARRLVGVAAKLAASEHTRLMLGFGGWLQARGWRAAADDQARAAVDAPAGQIAAVVLARCRKRLVAADPRAAPATPEQRHEVRIAAKRLRYAIEFFAALLPRHRARRLSAKLGAMQDLLGQLNDTAVADAALREIVRRRPALAQAAGFARGWLAADTREADARWPSALAACLAAKPAWRPRRGSRPPARP